jgi:two-component system sensor histidine kinase AgrC
MYSFYKNPTLSLKNKFREKKTWIFLLSLIILSLGFIFNIKILLKYTTTVNNFNLLLGGIYIVYFFLNIVFGIVLNNIIIKQQSVKRQSLYNKSIETVNDELSAVKQSFDNSINDMQDLINTGQYEKLKELMNENKSENILYRKTNIYMCEEIKNAGLLGLIVKKLDSMKSSCLDVKFIVHNEIDDIHMRIGDLCEVLGIIIDNAIESARETEEKHLKFVISNESNITSFLLENSSNGEFDIAKAYDLGWSTKSANRGMGLWIVNNIIKKYKNVTLNTSVEGKRVKQEIVILNN